MKKYVSNWLKITSNTILSTIVLSLLIFMLAAVMPGCTHTKKNKSQTQDIVKQGRDSIYIRTTNTIYTDTGSITTYYRDSLIYLRDTLIQPIDKIIYKWFKQDIKHDSFYIHQRDTVTVVKTVTVQSKDKTSLPWIWLIVLACIGVIAFLVKSYTKF